MLLVNKILKLESNLKSSQFELAVLTFSVLYLKVLCGSLQQHKPGWQVLSFLQGLLLPNLGWVFSDSSTSVTPWPTFHKT